MSHFKSSCLNAIYDVKIDSTKEELSKGVMRFSKYVDRFAANQALVDKSPMREAYDNESLLKG